MIGRFLDAGHSVSWVAGDEVYGGNPKLKSALQERGVGYVLAVACSADVTTGAGKCGADALVAKVPKRAWQKLSAGAGAKGHRFYDWAIIGLVEPRPGSHQLLIRRNRITGELAFYRCWSPAAVPTATLVRVAGSRWRVEETFQSGKGLAGLDEHGPPLHLLGPLGHPGHARPRLPRRRPRRRARPPSGPGRADPAHLQRDPATVHDARRPACARCDAPASLVRLATPPPGPRPSQPLPQTNRESGMKITFYS